MKMKTSYTVGSTYIDKMEALMWKYWCFIDQFDILLIYNFIDMKLFK